MSSTRDMHRRIADLEVQSAKLLDDNARLKSALAVFARRADRFDGAYEKGHPWAGRKFWNDYEDAPTRFQVGDLRQARTVYSA